MTAQQMPIFTRTFDFLTWLLPATNHFPRAHRHSFTARLLAAAFDLRERLVEANFRQGQARIEKLRQADECLARIRVYLRLAQGWGWWSHVHFRRTLTRKVRDARAGRRPVSEVSASVRGWVDHVKHANTAGLRKAVLRAAMAAGNRE